MPPQRQRDGGKCYEHLVSGWKDSSFWQPPTVKTLSLDDTYKALILVLYLAGVVLGQGNYKIQVYPLET